MSSSSGREASGASSMVWLGMRVMNLPIVWVGHARWLWHVTGKDGSANRKSDTGLRAPVPCHNPPCCIVL